MIMLGCIWVVREKSETEISFELLLSMPWRGSLPAAHTPWGLYPGTSGSRSACPLPTNPPPLPGGVGIFGPPKILPIPVKKNISKNFWGADPGSRHFGPKSEKLCLGTPQQGLAFRFRFQAIKKKSLPHTHSTHKNTHTKCKKCK